MRLHSGKGILKAPSGYRLSTRHCRKQQFTWSHCHEGLKWSGLFCLMYTLILPAQKGALVQT